MCRPAESACAQGVAAALGELLHPLVDLGEEALLVLQGARLLHLLHHVGESQAVRRQNSAVPVAQEKLLLRNVEAKNLPVKQNYYYL